MMPIIKAPFIGFISGLFASIPIGPAGLEAVNRSLSKGFWSGFKVSMGALVADYTYLLIINLGLFSMVNNNKFSEGLFWIISGIVLIIFARFSKKNKSSANKVSAKFVNSNKSKGFMSGFIITLINPLTFSFWIAFSGTVAAVWKSYGYLFFCISLLFMIIGSMSWLIILNILASKGLKLLKKDINKTASNLLTYVLYIIGIIFVIYGIYVIL